MEKLLELADQQPTTSEVITSEQINEEMFKQFLSKDSVWGFHYISREVLKKIIKSEKKYLVVRYYNEMLKGKIQFLLLLNYRLFFCFFLFLL